MPSIRWKISKNLELRLNGGKSHVEPHRHHELVGGLDVGHLLEYSHEFRQIEEPGEAGARPVAGALGRKLQGRDRLAEAGGPAVEVAHAHLLEPVVLQIPLDGIQLRHGVADGRACGENHAAAARDLVQITALGEHIAGLLGVGRGKPGDVPHLGIKEQIFVKVALVHEHPVHAQLLKGDHAVLAVAALDFLQVALQLLLGPLQLLDGEPLAAALLDLADALGDLEYLVLDDLPLPLRADRDLL